MRRYCGVVILVFLLEACAPSDPPRNFDADRLALLDTVVESAIEEGAARGAVLLVWNQGQPIYRKAFGLRSLDPQREPMTPDTIFDMASLTKVMSTAVSVMILIEEGRLSLSDRVSAHLPDFSKDNPEKRDIRVQDLLTHYSGLLPYFDPAQRPPWSGYAETVRMALEEPPIEKPRERFIYSDLNFILLAEIVRVVSGKRLDEFSQEKIFKPLGMNDTRFLPAPGQRPRTAPTEPRDGVMLRGEVHDPTSAKMGGVAGHAGLFSTVDDTARFARMFLGGGELEGVRILSPLSVRAMTGVQSPPGKAETRGLGFDIGSRYSTNRGDLLPKGSYGHTGFTGTSLWIDPQTETFVILFTSRLYPDGKGNVVSLRRRVASVAASALRGAGTRSRR